MCDHTILQARAAGSVSGDPSRCLQDACINQVEEGAYQALLLQFQLPSSAYATMLIREITKMPTDSGFQVQ
jgi:tRNA(Glu) U13 pseudouridine synthase TruD